MSETLFVINPVSGGLEKNELKDLVSESYANVEFLMTTGKDDDKKIAEKVKSNAYARVVAAGGDGTIALVANAMHFSHVPIGIIPVGSANGLASELGIPAILQESVKKAMTGDGRPFDIIEVNNQWHVLHMADFGMNATLVRRYQNDDHRGFLGYALSGLKELPNLVNANSFKLEFMEEKHQYESNFVIIANARQYGTGIEVNPQGKVDDGKFEICCLQNISFEDFLEKIIDDRAFEFSPFEIHSVDQATIRLKEPADFQIDGEYVGELDELKISTLKGAIQLIY